MQADEITVPPSRAPCLICSTLPQEPQINYRDYCIFSCCITWNSHDSCWHSRWCL